MEQQLKAAHRELKEKDVECRELDGQTMALKNAIREMQMSFSDDYSELEMKLQRAMLQLEMAEEADQAAQVTVSRCKSLQSELEAFEEQAEIDHAMVLLGPIIQSINGMDGLLTPHMVQHTHKTRHGIWGHRYAGTMTDGLHFNNHTKWKIARNITRTFYHNIHQTCN